MKKLFLDIETLPAEKEKHEILKTIHDRKKEKHYYSQKVVTFEEFIEQTGLDGSFGRICCLSYAIDDKPVKTLSGDEKEILNNFWEIAKDIDLFIGFNLIDFDMRFIYQRSIIHNVQPSKDLNFARYRNSPMYDVMWEWSRWSANRPNLDSLAKALGFPSSKGGEIEGKNVAKAYEDGRIKEICKYCEADVELTRQIYKKMNFEK